MAGKRETSPAARGSAGLATLLEKHGLPAVLLFLGDDRSDAEAALHSLSDRVAGDSGGLGVVRLRGPEDSVADVLGAAETLPMLGDRRLVVVRDPERLPGDQDALLAHLRNPCPTTCLLLVPSTFDRRLRLSTTLLEVASVVEFQAPGNADLQGWVRRTLSSRGITVEPDAMALLVDLVQADTLLLSNELEKLALAAAGTRRVTRADVEALLGRTRTVDIWALTNAIEDADPAAALTALSRLRDQGAAVPYLVAMVDWCLGRLVASEEPKAPPHRRRSLEARRGALAGRAEEVYALLRAADRLLRTTGGSVDGALERAVLAAAR